MARMQRSLFAQLNALAEEISQGSVKAAAEKSAGPVPADPGGYMGSSSHPSAHTDNRVQDAPEGARAREYESDIEDQQGAVSVDNAPEMSQEGRQDDVQLNINTNASAVGEDPSVEKDFKGTKDDPGTSHPAKTNDGEKYSTVTFKTARENCSNLGNDILANLINFGTAKLESAPAKKEEKAASAPAKTEPVKADESKQAAYNAGYELAEKLGVEKAAAEAAVREVCANTLREADEMADLLIGFMSTKSALMDVDDAAAGEDHSSPGDETSGTSDAPAAEAAALGGGDMGPEMAGAGPSDDEAVQELAMALEELGIPPEALLEALAGGGGEMGGDVPPEAAAMGGDVPPEGAAMGGGMPPEMAPKLAAAKELDSIGRAVVNFKRAGKFQVKEARTKRSRQLRDIMKQHVIELVNR